MSTVLIKHGNVRTNHYLETKYTHLVRHRQDLKKGKNCTRPLSLPCLATISLLKG